MSAYTIIFAPIGQATRSEQVVERLENAIISGLLKKHEQLPNESDLAQLMGVSPVTVREALNTLRVKGLIDTRRGRNGGSFVCELPNTLIMSQHPLRQASNEYLTDLGEMHSAIMAHSAYLAVSRSTSQDLQKLQHLIEQFAQCQTPDQRTQLDLRCLLFMASLAQSPRLANQELSLQAEWAPLTAVLYQDNNFHQSIVECYQQLLAAMRQANEQQAIQHIKTIMTKQTDQMLHYRLATQ
ncbi:FadR/GntR family transcriptional regulator [Acinetobacter larvae]|uniref:GntR family transcriptional regulator n=1 Tax=Acinetobacter larvae TaxID=1789224 RepID=A0A1B2M0K8_9GAMM|nr:GntR family transcriptional regulator [Acinetobacter larvae]AOA58720.1 GntR family transcriptional regulator [Acinetobacter larvae]